MENGKPWKFFLFAKDTWQALYEACQMAEKRIDFEQFIFEADDIGINFSRLFEKKAQSGVRVRLLCDMAGSYSFFNSRDAARLKACGVEVLFFNHISPWRAHNFPLWLNRDHRKLSIIDDSVAFIGGVGIADEQAIWRDTHLMLFDKDIIKACSRSFENMWNIAKSERFLPFPKSSMTNVTKFELVTNSPHRRERHIYYRYVEAIRSAKKYIYMTTPYFVPDRKFLRVVRLSARRGVDVRLLLPHKSDHFYVDKAGEYLFRLLFESGVRVYRYRSTMLHSKTIVIDDQWSSVGSCNLDNICLRFDYEATILSMNKRFSIEVKEQFMEDLKKADEVIPEIWMKRSRVQKLVEGFAAIFSKIL